MGDLLKFDMGDARIGAPRNADDDGPDDSLAEAARRGREAGFSTSHIASPRPPYDLLSQEDVDRIEQLADSLDERARTIACINLAVQDALAPPNKDSMQRRAGAAERCSADAHADPEVGDGDSSDRKSVV